MAVGVHHHARAKQMFKQKWYFLHDTRCYSNLVTGPALERNHSGLKWRSAHAPKVYSRNYTFTGCFQNSYVKLCSLLSLTLSVSSLVKPTSSCAHMSLGSLFFFSPPDLRTASWPQEGGAPVQNSSSVEFWEVSDSTSYFPKTKQQGTEKAEVLYNPVGFMLLECLYFMMCFIFLCDVNVYGR